MDKKRNNHLIGLADASLNELGKKGKGLFKDFTAKTIDDSYNGQVAALGVNIAMSGLMATLASYYSDSSDSRKVNRRNILEVIACMISKDKPNYNIKDAESLVRYAIGKNGDKDIKKEVEECSIALKQVVRTYNLA